MAPTRLGALLWQPLLIALLGVASALAITDVLTGLSLKWLVAMPLGAGLVLAALCSGHAKAVFIALLAFSLPIGFNLHITYAEGHTGIADGLTLEIIDVFLLLLFALWLNDRYSGRDTHAVRMYPAVTVPAAISFFFALLSFINSADQLLSSYGLIVLLKEFLLFVFIANLIKSLHEVKLVLIGFSAAVALIGMICIAQTILQFNFNAAFKIIPHNPYDHSVFRAGGLSTPTTTGAFLAALLLPVASLFFLFRQRRIKLWVAVAVTIGLTGMLLTLTRGAWICFALGGSVMTALYLRQRLIKPAYIVLLLLALVLLALPFQHLIIERLAEGSGNAVARFGLMQTALNMVQRYPFIGIGLNTYWLEMESFRPDFAIHSFRYVVHNTFMLKWAEIGSFGLLAYLWIWGVALLASYRLTRSIDKAVAIIAVGLLSSFISIGFNMQLEAFESTSITRQFWLMLGLAMMLTRLSQRPSKIHSSRTI